MNNAGFGHHSPIDQTTEEAFDDLMNVHFKGVYFLTQKILPILNDGGGIINISSGLARFSMPGASAYASMKGAVEVFTRYLAKELGAKGIRANIVAPGAIATDFGGGRVRDDAQVNQMVSSLTALGRPGEAEDIGGVVAFLCTDDARWINGQRIEVSGA
ncbi:SDR family NAD(P)-dependent oxidoreductase [Mucilaginibacter humi]|uniref:SDR family NAD(P)-dependent oxidoreductase n=1 Tax=Mucilaginibacter humi TaxID=2732510 RepID=UPI00293BB789|nr:SDR family oxidoreductase [Mucilaginibacter humi]